MLIEETTSAGQLIGGIASDSITSSTNAFIDVDYSPDILQAMMIEYNSPEAINTRVDDYINSNYNEDGSLSKKYSSIEYGFMNSVQNFAIEQINLDEDFSQILDELFISKINAKPTKKRF